MIRQFSAIFLLISLFSLLSQCQQQKPVPGTGTTTKKPTTMEIVVENAQFAMFAQESSQPSTSDLHKIPAGTKLSTKFAVDGQKKMQLTFGLKDKKEKGTALVTVHQAFVLLVHEATKREIIYVAEPDKTTNEYAFDLDMKTHAKDFSGVGGAYSAHLVLGDPSMANSLRWHFADLEFTVAPQPAPNPLPKSARINSQPLPEIRHQFRANEPRAPAILSDTFTAVCAAPLLLLLILWLRIAPNFGNMKYSIWALGFHAGLCAIFGLYVCYWLRLDMFETLKWLAIIGLPTLFCGNRLLHSFSDGGGSKKQKPE